MLTINRIDANTSDAEVVAAGLDGECHFDDCVAPQRLMVRLYLSNGMVAHVTACARHAQMMLDSLSRE